MPRIMLSLCGEVVETPIETKMGQKENFAEYHDYAKFSDIILDLEGEPNPQELVCLAGSRDLNNLSAASNP